MAKKKTPKTEEKKKWSFIWQDYLIFFALALNAVARFMTNFLVSTLSAYVAQANVLETNPAERTAVTSSYLVQFILFTIECAVLLTLYISIRKIRERDESTKVIFNFMTLTAFLIMLFDAVNDVSIVLGILLH
jgi:glucan phosphoethanolaminetransferase (alkaline phosphatase superfamily)